MTKIQMPLELVAVVVPQVRPYEAVLSRLLYHQAIGEELVRQLPLVKAIHNNMVGHQPYRNMEALEDS